MAKPKSPLLSLGARGTIAKSLTFQKRGRGTIARKKPIPTDPKSTAQLAWRQIYRDAVAAWHALTAEEKEAWRSVCPGLTGYQCFLRSELKYVPPPIPIDIGAEAIVRTDAWPAGYTVINKENPADGSGTIVTIEIFVELLALEDCQVGTFYLTNGATLKCRDSVFIGAAAANSKHTFDDLAIAVETGDFIGMFYPHGSLERDKTGFAGLWYVAGNKATPGDESDYSFLDGDVISLYGTGEQA